MTKKKLSIGVKITGVSPGHTRFRLYVNLIPTEQYHSEATRAGLGEEQCLRNDEFKPFMLRLRPDIFTLAYSVRTQDILNATGVKLEPLTHEPFWFMELS